MKQFLTLVCAYWLFLGIAFAQSPVELTIYSGNPGKQIPSRFLGLSFETGSLAYDNAGVNGYFFDPGNKQLITLFRNIGIKSLRIGGSSVDRTSTPSDTDIDALFGFVKAAGVKVIYSLRLANGDSVHDASTAKYVWDNYRQYLSRFAIGNEPNLFSGLDPEISDFTTFLAKWRRFAAVVEDSVPGALFGGPDNGTGGTSWGSGFIRSEAGSGIVNCLQSHFYVGGFPKTATAEQLIDGMLSPTWDSSEYPAYFDSTGAVALSLGLPYRLTESNSYVTGNPGVWGGNNAFSTALFVLDYMYWWAEHGCLGVNFHTAQWKYNGTVYRDQDGNYHVYPMAYGMKAFTIGGTGNFDSLNISNPDDLDLTAYTVADSGSIYVTIVNKEHGTGAKDASVAIGSSGLPTKAAVMRLTSPGNNAGAVTGIRLGGSTISDSIAFQGRWTLLESVVSGSCMVNVPPTSAAIVWFSNEIPTALPAAPALVSPDGNGDVSINPILKWNFSGKYGLYRLQVATDSDFADVAADTIVSGSSVTLGTRLSYMTKYFWRVSALDSLMAGPYSPADSFTTMVGVPAKPTLVSPSMYQTGVPRRISFEWHTSALATNYRFQLATNNQVYTTGDSSGAFVRKNVVLDTVVADTACSLTTPLDSLTTYYYHVAGIDSTGIGLYSIANVFVTGTGLTAVLDAPGLPQNFSLSQNYPNPFNPTTELSYDVPKTSLVVIKVYDSLGREVGSLVDAVRTPGRYSVAFNGSRLASGVYFIRMIAGNFVRSQKALLVK